MTSLEKVFVGDFVTVIEDYDSEKIIMYFEKYDCQEKIRILYYGTFVLEEKHMLQKFREVTSQLTFEEYEKELQEFKQSDFLKNVRKHEEEE